MGSVNNTFKEKNHPRNRNNESSGQKGGKTAKLEIRCPQCYKLYSVSPGDIHSNKPQFECQSCHCHFEFDYPPKNNKAIYTRTLSLPQIGQLAKMSFQNAGQGANPVAIKSGPELRSCPKCSTMNPRGVSECYRCGVIMNKVETTGHLPSLVKMWQELLHDYNNMTKHVAFVDRCEELQALPFALKKYEELKQVQPQDSLAHQMLNSVLIKSLSRQASHMVEHRSLRFLKDIPYANLRRISPLFFSLLFILWGILSHGSRNLAGAGVALLVLVLGFTYVSHGTISWRNFWK